MRFALIDGVYVDVDCCGHCPFFSTEYELKGTCNYPKSSVGSFSCFSADEGVRDDCPLKSTENLEKLLKRNCPFCDADPINLSLIITEFDTPAIYCNECNMIVESAEPDMTAEGLIKIWNKEVEE